MKLYKDIHKHHIDNINFIDNLKNQIKSLEYRDAIGAAIDARDFNRVKELHAAANGNAAEINALNDQILFLQVQNKFLQVNEKAALFAENYPKIAAIFAPYEGRPYGEKTKEKFYNDIHAAGLSAWFSWSHNGSAAGLHIAFLNAEGYKDHGAPELFVYTRENTVFIDTDNKIRVAGAAAAISEKYTDNPAKAARNVLKAFKAYKTAVDKAGAAQKALNDILPYSMNAFNAVSDVYGLF